MEVEPAGIAVTIDGFTYRVEGEGITDPAQVERMIRHAMRSVRANASNWERLLGPLEFSEEEGDAPDEDESDEGPPAPVAHIRRLLAVRAEAKAAAQKGTFSAAPQSWPRREQAAASSSAALAPAPAAPAPVPAAPPTASSALRKSHSRGRQLCR